MSELVPYYDGGHVDRLAVLDVVDGAEVLVLDDGARRIPVNTHSTTTGGSIARNVSPLLARVAYALLALFKQRGASYGARVSATVEGRHVVALFQEHPADAGISEPHPGVTLLDFPAGEIELAHAPEKISSFPPLLALGLGAVVLYFLTMETT